jgi:hypothetical protein
MGREENRREHSPKANDLSGAFEDIYERFLCGHVFIPTAVSRVGLRLTDLTHVVRYISNYASALITNMTHVSMLSRTENDLAHGDRGRLKWKLVCKGNSPDSSQCN